MLDRARRVVYRHWQKFHGIRRIELATLRRYLDARPGEMVLDLGSGKGAFCGELSRRGIHAVGVDTSLPALAIARRWVDPRGRFVRGSGEDLPFDGRRFDRAVSVCVLEHTRDDARVLAEVFRVVKPGGVFALSVDCLDSPHVTAEHREHHVREYRCNQLYDERRIRRMLDAAGFEVIETRHLFSGRWSVALLRWGSRFHYRGPFILLFPAVLPALWLGELLSKKTRGGMILTIRARRRASPSDAPAATIV
jgi:SAM-dependent methyltransferase